MQENNGNSNKVSKVVLSLYAQKLKNVAGAFKGTSDPYAVVTLLANAPGEQPNVVGKTEVMKNDLSPRWTATFVLEYQLGKPSKVNISIFDEIKKAKNDKSMGSAVFEVGEVLGSRGNIKAKKLKNGGTIFCRIQPAPEEDMGTFHFSLRGVKLKNVDGLFGKSDPFFELSRLINAGGGPTWQVVYRSKVIQNDLNPKWESVSIGLNELCEGDKSKGILVTVKDHQKNGRHDAMGFFETSVNGLIAAKTSGGTGDPKSIDTSKAFKLTRKGKSFGHLVVTTAMITGGPQPGATAASAPPSAPGGSASSASPFSESLNQPPPTTGATAPFMPGSMPEPVPVPVSASAPSAPVESSVYVPMAAPLPSPARKPRFLDYVSGGLELQLSVAIDFTGSNGDPRRPGTLHYIHRDGNLNDYEKAISAVGSTIAKYDSDQKFPVLGFGAKFRGVINHCFQLGPTPEVKGIKGIIDTYRRTFSSGLVMSGPTVFAEIINLVAAQARSKQEAALRIGQQFYQVLLILTDGAVSDLELTKRTIQAASDAPLSIVIVGIGNADFSSMRYLDDFQGSTGSGRDICQFVDFQRFRNNKVGLTQATLDELPDQVVDYFHGRGTKPLPAVSGSQMNIVPDEYDEEMDVDLTINISDDGEINLSGGVADETDYGNYNTFTSPPPAPTAPFAPGAPSAPGAPPAPYAPGAPPAPAAPYAPGAPPAQAAPYAPSPYAPGAPPAQAAPYQPQPSPYQQQPQAFAYQGQSTYGQPLGYAPGAAQPQAYPQQAAVPQAYGAPPAQAAIPGQQPYYPPNQFPGAQPVAAPTMLNVQVPAGAIPGTQMQVWNPKTGQMVFVVIPPGLVPGQTFAVNV